MSARDRAQAPGCRPTLNGPNGQTTPAQEPHGYSADPGVVLMLRVRDEEPGAFGELVERYWPKVFGRFLRTVANRQDAEDMAQEVFLRLYRARENYEPRAKFNTWLFHIVQNVTRNAIRARRRKPVVRLNPICENEDTQFPPEQLWTDESDSPSRPLERSELAGVVREAVSDLGERQRQAVELHQFQHHTYAEVAESMDMTPKAAKSLLYRARIQLRSQLAKFAEAV